MTWSSHSGDGELWSDSGCSLEADWILLKGMGLWEKGVERMMSSFSTSLTGSMEIASDWCKNPAREQIWGRKIRSPALGVLNLTIQVETSGG